MFQGSKAWTCSGVVAAGSAANTVFFKIVDTFFSRYLLFFAVDVLLPIWIQEHASDSGTVSYVPASPS